MNDEELRTIIARNIAFYRKDAGHTQAALAELLQYSDKSISKWERGDGLPDICVLYRIAGLYHITVNDLLDPKAKRNKAQQRLLIMLLSMGLVWLIAVIAFFILMLFDFGDSWLCFIYAIPACGILATIFCSLWYSYLPRCISVSFLIWSCALSIHLTASVIPSLPNLPLIYMIAGVMQLLCIGWFLLRSKKHSQTTALG